jgi:hypothetical protein
LFEYPLISQAVYDETGKLSHFKYNDGEQALIFSKKLNFTPIYLATDKYRYGNELPNGTFIGAMGAMEYGNSDINCNNLILMDYNTTNTLFLKPILEGNLMFVIPTPATRKELLIALFKSFDVPTVFLAFLCILIFPPIFYFITRIRENSNDPENIICLSWTTL